MSIEQFVPDPEALVSGLRDVGYLADPGLATALFCAVRLPQPLLLEGEAGVGKTQSAASLARLLDTPLIRLQCYEGIDAAEALYEWNYPRQLLRIRLAEAGDRSVAEEELFGPDYLVQRPLLAAIEHPGPRPAVLLIDEVDRADEEFEAFLLELLSDFAITVPEIGTLRADRPPRVILTSNRTREIHDALKRRCLYHWIDYPTAERELAILLARQPQVPAQLADEVVRFVQRLRQADLTKVPGIAETLDWAAALVALGATRLESGQVDETLGVLLKYQEDVAAMKGPGARGLVAEIRAS